ncbi:AMP-binding protein [uncultured Sunxiuqinia sp.]|uniref:AMP-binding protein n=1 Tax=uncultured Sunxiuqinia sp. TaxID=1573825 RepID=UPI0026142C73|nr:AMP-binding protein [uncultured Sunxiuqinia sp.]
MNLFPSHIKLNGRPTAVANLLQQQAKAGWEKEWLDFLAEWYAPQDFIEVNTSGSTGTPKTIRLTKEFVAASAQRTLHFFNLKQDDRVLHCLPTRYIAGKLMVVRALVGQLDLQVVDPASDFQLLNNQSFQFAAMVTNQVYKILESGIENLESLLIGGSAVPQTLTDQLQKVSTACYSSYAMTETATHIALRKLNGEDRDEFYHILDGIELSLSDEGCLQIQMAGLENNFIQTTDLAELIDSKTFKILGRSDHVIISGGIKFIPEKLEQKLEPYLPFPFLITSRPHEKLGQQLVLLVEASESAESMAELTAICQQQLDKFERPRAIEFTNTLPRTPNGKILRKGS